MRGWKDWLALGVGVYLIMFTIVWVAAGMPMP